MGKYFPSLGAAIYYLPAISILVCLSRRLAFRVLLPLHPEGKAAIEPDRMAYDFAGSDDSYMSLWYLKASHDYCTSPQRFTRDQQLDNTIVMSR